MAVFRRREGVNGDWHRLDEQIGFLSVSPQAQMRSVHEYCSAYGQSQPQRSVRCLDCNRIGGTAWLVPGAYTYGGRTAVAGVRTDRTDGHDGRT